MARLNHKYLFNILKYSLIGAAAGLVFPVVGYVVIIFFLKPQTYNVFELATQIPAFTVAMGAPIILGIAGFVFSYRFQTTLSKAENIIKNQHEMITKVTAFADKIGSGDLNVELNIRKEDEALGKSLLTMKENLRVAAVREEERSWIITGVAEVGNIIRSNDNLSSLAEQLLPFLVKRVGAIQGAFYVVNEDEYGKNFIEMMGCYA
ncbi:MAG: hypothetical protein H7329_17500, partial [Opitutaceae bacterium]|nr:hypothetical protein [Cytophagales bacterium]